MQYRLLGSFSNEALFRGFSSSSSYSWSVLDSEMPTLQHIIKDVINCIVNDMGWQILIMGRNCISISWTIWYGTGLLYTFIISISWFYHPVVAYLLFLLCTLGSTSSCVYESHREHTSDCSFHWRHHQKWPCLHHKPRSVLPLCCISSRHLMVYQHGDAHLLYSYVVWINVITLAALLRQDM